MVLQVNVFPAVLILIPFLDPSPVNGQLTDFLSFPDWLIDVTFLVIAFNLLVERFDFVDSQVCLVSLPVSFYLNQPLLVVERFKEI